MLGALCKMLQPSRHQFLHQLADFAALIHRHANRLLAVGELCRGRRHRAIQESDVVDSPAAIAVTISRQPGRADVPMKIVELAPATVGGDPGVVVPIPTLPVKSRRPFCLAISVALVQQNAELARG
jgi:hypothetical protein